MCLWPSQKCLWLCALPFAEEVRRIAWGAAPTNRPSAEQLGAAEALIDALELRPTCGADGQLKEPLRPKDIFNPKLQRTFQCIQHRALHGLQGTEESNALPPPSPLILEPFTPNALLFENAREAITLFQAQCPLTVGTLEMRKRGATDQDNDPKRLKTSLLGFDDNNTLQLKMSSVEQAAGLAALSACYSPPRPLPSRLHFGVLRLVPFQVDSAKPVDTFWTMLNDEAHDWTVKAITQMADVIRNLLERAVLRSLAHL